MGYIKEKANCYSLTLEIIIQASRNRVISYNDYYRVYVWNCYERKWDDMGLYVYK